MKELTWKNQLLIRICGTYGLQAETVRDFLEHQILTDFMITNTEQFVSMAPIFDSGNSMFGNREIIPTGDNQIDISLLPTRREVRDLLERDSKRNEQREAILDAYERKIDLLNCFQIRATI